MDHLKQRFVTIVAGLLTALPFVSTASADEILLRGGGRVSGVIVERTPHAVAIETGPGRVTLPMSRVESIVESGSFLAEFRDKAARLEARDVAGWAALARWAEDRDLLTPAGEAWRHVLALDPDHPEANAALGRVEVGGVWMEADDGYRARGLVPFEGRWLTPAAHEAVVRERAFEEASAREQREADIRLREADARAREAEARAREAETAAADASLQPGEIPLWWGFGGGAILPPFGHHPGHLVPDGTRPHRGRSGEHVRPPERVPQPTPPPTPPPTARPPAASKKAAPFRPATTPKPREH